MNSAATGRPAVRRAAAGAAWVSPPRPGTTRTPGRSRGIRARRLGLPDPSRFFVQYRSARRASSNSPIGFNMLAPLASSMPRMPGRASGASRPASRPRRPGRPSDPASKGTRPSGYCTFSAGHRRDSSQIEILMASPRSPAREKARRLVFNDKLLWKLTYHYPRRGEQEACQDRGLW